MDVFEIRKVRLRELIDSNFDGVQRRFADAIDRQPDYVSRILRGTKRLGEQLARDIENTLGLPPRWLDTAHLEADSPTSQSEIAPAEQRGAGAGIDSTGILQVTPQQRKVIMELLDMVDGDAEKLSRLVDMYKTFKEMEGGAP